MRNIQAVSFVLWAVASAAEVASTARASDIASFAVESPAMVDGPQDIRPGKLVQSPEGKVIGKIKAIVAGPRRGAVRYALVTTDAGVVPIPCWAISHLLRDGHIVVGRQLLAYAPRIPQGQAQGATHSDWKTRANDYWRKWR